MSWKRQCRVLQTTFSFAVYISLLIHHGDTKCVSEARRVVKAGCNNYCPENQCPEECTDCISGFYGPDCRRSCRGHCFNGRCDLLTNGRAVNCTDGCELGWRGLTCNTKCKRPCLKCDRYTGNCVGQCRDGFCGPGCLQRCLYSLSACDKSCARPLKMTQTLEPAHHRSHKSKFDIKDLNNTHHVHKEEHPQQSAAEVTPDYGTRQITPYFHAGAGIAVLAAVTAVIVVSVIRLRSQKKIDSVGKPHTCEESHRFLAVKSNIISVIPPSRSHREGSGPETCTTEMGVLVQNNHYTVA
ncbi:uncharacterized protein [Haliotis asinina]|uniref:uncharacterized protein n=1 Tax=Haliotis asinina TaxID=109174 RepID=UPI003531D045